MLGMGSPSPGPCMAFTANKLNRLVLIRPPWPGLRWHWRALFCWLWYGAGVNGWPINVFGRSQLRSGMNYA